MHEDAPKMSVAHSIVASTSQAKSEIDLEVPMEYVNSTESKPSQSIEMELKIAYVDTNSVPTDDASNMTVLFSVSVFELESAKINWGHEV
ncbi:unnamed protein product [Arctia plantaginis]|uniref:Uncharacterized protein n=1 Tax=Arctia plantaginis TaxID=874455 RepID=A0A8S1BDR9_ARCPL|nr:unnamed protein product [Arctia plantaginis]CAB3257981.1 unnamed protein product [Arctia plantaginis]